MDVGLSKTVPISDNMNDLTEMILTTVKTAVSDSDQMIATRKNEIYEAATNLYIFLVVNYKEILNILV